jgi:hypothetical protein
MITRRTVRLMLLAGMLTAAVLAWAGSAFASRPHAGEWHSGEGITFTVEHHAASTRVTHLHWHGLHFHATEVRHHHHLPVFKSCVKTLSPVHPLRYERFYCVTGVFGKHTHATPDHVHGDASIEDRAYIETPYQRNTYQSSSWSGRPIGPHGH